MAKLINSRGGQRAITNFGRFSQGDNQMSESHVSK